VGALVTAKRLLAGSERKNPSLILILGGGKLKKSPFTLVPAVAAVNKEVEFLEQSIPRKKEKSVGPRGAKGKRVKKKRMGASCFQKGISKEGSVKKRVFSQASEMSGDRGIELALTRITGKTWGGKCRRGKNQPGKKGTRLVVTVGK